MFFTGFEDSVATALTTSDMNHKERQKLPIPASCVINGLTGVLIAIQDGHPTMQFTAVLMVRTTGMT
jgi:hypothetical protein